jgi:hypothetical protein
LPSAPLPSAQRAPTWPRAGRPCQPGIAGGPPLRNPAAQRPWRSRCWGPAAPSRAGSPPLPLPRPCCLCRPGSGHRVMMLSATWVALVWACSCSARAGGLRGGACGACCPGATQVEIYFQNPTPLPASTQRGNSVQPGAAPERSFKNIKPATWAGITILGSGGPYPRAVLRRAEGL